LRLAIKEIALTSSGKVLREEAIPSFVHVLHERPGLPQFTAKTRGWDMGSKWKELPFTEAVHANPKVSLKKGQQYPFVDMKRYLR